MASLVLTAETLVTVPSAGQEEFSGTIFTGAPTSTTRGIIPTEQFFRLNADLAGANATGAQNIFGVGVTLASSTVYEFEIVFGLVKSAGTTSHTISTLFGGTVTLNNIVMDGATGQSTQAPPIPNNNGTAFIFTNSAAAVVHTSAITSAAETFGGVLIGTVSINAGGTFIPQYSLSAAPGGAYSTLAGSYMKIKPIGVSGANTSVGTWA